MRTGWSYRVGSAAGVAALAMVAAFVANQPLLQSAFTTYVPLFWRLEPVVLSGGRLGATLLIAAAVFVGCFVPLFKPRPRRVLDTVALTHKRVVVAGCVLATLGFFEWSYRLPRTTLVLTCGVLAVALPAWFVAIRWRPAGESDRVVVVGDDTQAMETVLEATDQPILGYVSPLQRAIVRADEASRQYSMQVVPSAGGSSSSGWRSWRPGNAARHRRSPRRGSGGRFERPSNRPTHPRDGSNCRLH